MHSSAKPSSINLTVWDQFCVHFERTSCYLLEKREWYLFPQENATTIVLSSDDPLWSLILLLSLLYSPRFLRLIRFRHWVYSAGICLITF